MRRERRDGLPLAAKEMSRLFPSLWATEKAAERWTEKTPQRLRTLLSGVGASELPRSAPGLAPDWHPGQTHARVRAGIKNAGKAHHASALPCKMRNLQSKVPEDLRP